MGDDYGGGIAQEMNYWIWLQIKRVKISATTTQQQKKYIIITIQAKNLITYGNALSAKPFFSQITLNLIFLSKRQVG